MAVYCVLFDTISRSFLFVEPKEKPLDILCRRDIWSVIIEARNPLFIPMKRYLLPGVIVILLLIGAVVYFRGGSPQVAPAETKTPALNEQTSADKGAATDSPTINSIKDALSLGKKMQCTYADASGGKPVQSTMTIDGKRFRVAMDTPEGKSFVVSDGETQYFWTEKDKKGFKMNQTCLADVQKSLPESMQGNASASAPEDVTKGFDTAQDVHCQPVAAVDTSVPADVAFTDQCAMMKQSLDALKGMQIPKNVNVPNMPVPY